MGKREKIHWRNFKKSSGDGALKLQISVPFRGRMRPEIQNSFSGTASVPTNISGVTEMNLVILILETETVAFR